MIACVPKMRSEIGGSATERPIVVTTLISVDRPRTNRKSTA